MAFDLAAELASLPDDVRWRLERSDGFMDLKMTDAARKELERVPQDLADHVAVKHYRLRLLFEEGRWAEARCLARELHQRIPEDPVYWVQLAYSTRRVEGIEPARSILKEAMGKFPTVAVIPFNLACYECQLGQLDEAMSYLDRAFQIDAGFRGQALDDEDLKPLWPRIDA